MTPYRDEDDLAAARGMYRGLILGLIMWLVLAATAAGVAQAKRYHAAADPCAGAYVTLSVDNQAGVKVGALSLVEYATVIQSEQVRDAWGTPCVQFGAGGWPVTLTASAPQRSSDGSTSQTMSGRHSSPPSATVDTGGLPVQMWARAFTHEVAEMLVDPTLTRRWPFGLVEICDPVEDSTYSIAGVQVSDFVYPSYYTGQAGPFDQARRVTAAFSLSR